MKRGIKKLSTVVRSWKNKIDFFSPSIFKPPQGRPVTVPIWRWNEPHIRTVTSLPTGFEYVVKKEKKDEERRNSKELEAVRAMARNTPRIVRAYLVSSHRSTSQTVLTGESNPWLLLVVDERQRVQVYICMKGWRRGNVWLKRINELLRSNYSYLFSSFPILMEGKQRMVVWIGTTISTSHLSLYWHCAILLTVEIFYGKKIYHSRLK